MTDEILHTGVKRRSGRYKWGSGKDPQRSQDILARTDEMRFKGMSEKEIADELGMSITKLRSEKAWANEVRKNVIAEGVRSRRERGLTYDQIAEEMDISAASARNYETREESFAKKQLATITDILTDSVDEYGYLDVGIGVERQIGVSRTKLKAAVDKLKEEGYVEHEIYVKRLNDSSKYTTIKVLTKETDLEVVKANSDKIRPVQSWTDDGGITRQNMKPPQPIDWERVEIRYGDKGGESKDGVIEMRRNVDDLDLGGKNYAQVRIQVGDTHYLKGMAMYSDDLPAGKDIVFNTNKPSGTPKEDVLKPLKNNADNPFGATINRQAGALNILSEEGDWSIWGKTLSSQFLSKQPTKLVKERLDATLEKAKAEFDVINSLTNPAVKKHLMEAYSNELDSKARHLKAQGIPNMGGHVILPFPDMNANEVYAPNYNDGDKVVLVRYPHGGIFELPELTVNNKGPAKKVLGTSAPDAIGIHPSVATKLSGADFDGDTVYVLPNNNRKIKTGNSLDDLKDFSPNKYAVDHDTISQKNKQTQMGIVSNLITDMTIKGATEPELARAVRHSMVVIDSWKHKLDWKQSAKDNGIAALQKRYQTYISPLDGKVHVGASTLVSKSKSSIQVGGVKEKYIDKRTGKTKTTIKGGEKVALIDMFDDAHALSSGTAVENLYADYINKMKALRNTAQKEYMATPSVKRNKEAATKYANEVKTLDQKLNIALLNAPLERQAQLMATQTYYTKLKEGNYDFDSDQKKKLKSQAMAGARVIVGANKTLVDVTPREWEAIQAGAISNNKLVQILQNTDMDKIKKYATPAPESKLSTAKTTRAMTLLSRGYTQAEVADAIGVSVNELRNALAVE